MKQRFSIKIALLLLAVIAISLSLASGLFLNVPEASAEEPEQLDVSEPLPPPPQPSPGQEHGLGFVPSRTDLPHLTGSRPTDGMVRLMDSPPSSFDWRDLGKVTPVKDQGQCGSCYAFAAIANIESKLLIDTGTTYDLSENHAKECNYHAIIGQAGSCDGGDDIMVVNLFSQKGVVLESYDPYVDSDVSCNASCPYLKTLLDWRIICSDTVPDTTVLKNYIQTYGPVFTTIYASFDGFNTYNGTGTLYYPGTDEVNHAVLIVGWDDSLEYDKGGGETGYGAWICKNSWSTLWGDSGYFNIAYGSASIGKFSAFAYTLQDYDENGGIMYYDEGGWADEAGYLNTTAWGLCKFVPSSNTWVTRVEFWTTDITDDIDIYLYDDFNGTATTNLLASKTDSSFTEAGYHSVQLDSPLPVTAGDDVIVAVKFTNHSYGLPVAIDDVGPTETQRTYVSPNGSSGTWTDLGTFSGGVDAAIRLRTSDPPTADFSASVTSGSAPLAVTFTDNSTGIVTGWSWNFGDGGASANQSPSHQYTTAGTHTVSLTVTGPTGNNTMTRNNYITVSPGPLHHVAVNPSSVSVLINTDQPFSAAGQDQYSNNITGLSFTWNVDNVTAGAIVATSNTTALFTAGETPGTYTNTVNATCQQNTNYFNHATVTIVSAITIHGTWSLQGGDRPPAGHNTNINIKFFTPPLDVWSGTPAASYTYVPGGDSNNITGISANVSSHTVSGAIVGLPPGTYDITIVSDHTLMNAKRAVSIQQAEININFGTLLEGNCNNDRQVDALDFSILVSSFGKSTGEPSFNDSTDFDETGHVDSLDFSLLAGNYFRYYAPVELG